MRIAGIDYPEPLLAALREGRLVVFAGAGVSRGKPAGLPNFDDLAEEIARGTGKAKAEGETTDRFLGRLKESGVNVHKLAAEVLARDALSSNSLHRNLLNCFPRAHPLRVVTTNFDRLFEHAGEDLPASRFSGFSAPALPIGDHFDGLVHVHGSVSQPETMVLTDEDFGRAYLTEGWARRFLLDLFRSFTVLFVGYSHSDVVMSYLGRALPPPDDSRLDTPRRFALTDEASHSRWQLLRISPISYPMAEPGDHSGLSEGVAELADYVQRDLLGWQRRIGDMAQGPPPLNPEDQDLISDALRHPDRVRFFTNVATDPKWMEWLNRRGHLTGLFDATPSGIDDGVSGPLAGWLCRRFAREHADDMLRVFGWQGMRFGRQLWGALARELGAGSEETREPPVWDPEVVAKWIAILLDKIPYGIELLDVRLRHLAEAAARAGLDDELIAVFDTMAGLSKGDRYAYVDRARALDRVWTKDLAPRVPFIAERLLVVAMARLTRRHQWAHVWEHATRESGTASRRRKKIEARDDDSHRYDSNDVLIDAARDYLICLVEHEPLVAAGRLDQMIRADAPLLRRIAIHCAALRGGLSAAQKTNWLLQHISLHDRACQRELRLFADLVFQELSVEQKQRFLAAVDDYPNPAQYSNDDTDTYVADCKMDWLVRLQRIDPDCPHTAAALAKLSRGFPQLSIERDFDLDAPRSEFKLRERESPWTAEELLIRPASEWLPQLLDFNGDDPLGPNLGRLLEQVKEAAAERFDWGIELADALVDRRHWNAPLWDPLLDAWQTERGEAEYRQVLSRLRFPDMQRRYAQAVCRVLARTVSGGRGPFAREVFSVANDLASALWMHVREDANTSDHFDWYTLAINRAAGPYVEFWLGSLSIAIREQLVTRGRLREPYRSVFDEIMQDLTPAGRMGRAFLMSGFAFLLSVDETWTRGNLAPLLEEPPESEEFQAAWDGLMYGSLDVSTVDALTEPFQFAASHVQTFRDPHTRERFIDHLVDLLIDFVDDPIGDWIPSFLVNAGDDDRQHFAWAIWRRLSEMPDADTQELWNRWLRRYWDNRLNGVPVPLHDIEVEQMRNWLPQFDGPFVEAVDLAVQMPLISNDPFFLLDDLKEGEQCEKEPVAVADLLIRMAESDLVTAPLSDWETLIDRLMRVEITEDRSDSLRELRTRLGLS